MLAASALADEAAQLYIKKPTWPQTMLATRAALKRHAQTSGFSPLLSPLMRKGARAFRVSVDVSAVDRMFLVADHDARRASIPAVWGDAKLIAKDGSQVPLSRLKPASIKAYRRRFLRDRGLDGKRLRIGDKQFDRGVLAVAPAEISYKLSKKYQRFEAWIGISDAADKRVQVRFKVLDRPGPKDLAARLWKRIQRDSPLEASMFYRDGPYWLCNADNANLEKRLTMGVLRRIGRFGGAIRKDLDALSKIKTGPEDPRRLVLYAKTCRFYDGQNKLGRVKLDAMRPIIQNFSTERARQLARLEQYESRLSAIHNGMVRGDESVLNRVPQFLPDAQGFLRELLIPALGTDEIVFAVREPGRDGHWYANFGYWCSDPKRKIYGPGGSRLQKLNMRTGKVTVLLDDPKGAVRDPQVGYDGRRILFSYRKGGTDHYNLYEIDADGSGLRQITDGQYDDIEPTYLPGGDIMFCSSRCNRWVNCWHTQVAILHRCDADGKNIRVISSNIEHDNSPWPLPDGRIIYTRWEYVDRSQMAFHHLWTINPDGTGQMAYYGNMHPGMVMIDAKPIPGTGKIVAVFCPGHGRREHAGAIRIVTPHAGPDDKASARIVNRANTFRDPYPLSEDLFLVACDNRLLLMDGKGGTQELFRTGRHMHEPRPVVARPRETKTGSRVRPDRPTGRLILQDIYKGRNMAGVKRGEVKKLLVLESLPKPVNHSGGMDMTSAIGTFTLERVLGTVPVEPDGSAFFEVPANRAVFFVALDQNDMSVKRMHSFVSVLPGETTGCVGCHERRVRAPANGPGRVFQAVRRPPSRIKSFDGVPDVIDFPRHVQPILDKHCVKCHNYEKRSGGVVLVGDFGARTGPRRFTQGYWTLLLRRQVVDGANHYGNTGPRAVGTSASPLMEKIRSRHNGVSLSEREKRTVWLWIESGAAYAGTYAALRMTGGPSASGPSGSVIRRRCSACHTKSKMTLPTNLRGIKPHYYREIPKGAERFATPLLFNESRPEKSLFLLAPLAREAGGYGSCPGPVFRDKNDPDYRKLLAGAQKARDYLNKTRLYHQPGFRPNEHYVREMKRYGVLQSDLAKDAAIDVYETDQAYWQSMWHRPDAVAR